MTNYVTISKDYATKIASFLSWMVGVLIVDNAGRMRKVLELVVIPADQNIQNGIWEQIQQSLQAGSDRKVDTAIAEVGDNEWTVGQISQRIDSNPPVFDIVYLQEILDEGGVPEFSFLFPNDDLPES